MGERVFVRTSPVQPIDSDDGPRIDYAKPDVNSHFPTAHKAIAWLRYASDTIWQALRPAAAKLMLDLGGRRQVTFAIGVMFFAGGLGGALTRDLLPIFWMALGGLIIGSTVHLGDASKADSPRKEK